MRIKNLHILLLVASMGFGLFGSCEPDGADIGDLYGRWHLKSIDSDGGPLAHNDSLFLSFQGSAYQYLDGWGNFDWGTYRRTSDSLVLNPLAYGGDFRSLHLPPDPKRQPTGFQLKKLSDSRLIIARHDTVWSFTKYLE